jgi:hypothetical protein
MPITTCTTNTPPLLKMRDGLFCMCLATNTSEWLVFLLPTPLLLQTWEVATAHTQHVVIPSPRNERVEGGMLSCHHGDQQSHAPLPRLANDHQRCNWFVDAWQVDATSPPPLLTLKREFCHHITVASRSTCIVIIDERIRRVAAIMITLFRVCLLPFN